MIACSTDPCGLPRTPLNPGLVTRSRPLSAVPSRQRHAVRHTLNGLTWSTSSRRSSDAIRTHGDTAAQSGRTYTREFNRKNQIANDSDKNDDGDVASGTVSASEPYRAHCTAAVGVRARRRRSVNQPSSCVGHGDLLAARVAASRVPREHAAALFLDARTHVHAAIYFRSKRSVPAASRRPSSVPIALLPTAAAVNCSPDGAVNF